MFSVFVIYMARQLGCFIQSSFIKAQKMSGIVCTDYLICQDRTDLFRIPLQSILYLESQNYIVILHTSTTTHSIRITLKELENILITKDFFRIHMSYLVNLEHITHAGATDIELDNGEHLKISRNRKAAFQQALYNFIDKYT